MSSPSMSGMTVVLTKLAMIVRMAARILVLGQDRLGDLYEPISDVCADNPVQCTGFCTVYMHPLIHHSIEYSLQTLTADL